MDKKLLIGVSILAVVLLVLGSLSNVVGYQINKTTQQNLFEKEIHTSTLTQTEGLKIINITTRITSQDVIFYTELVVCVQNIGNETINHIYADGECNRVFFYHNNIKYGGPYTSLTLEPGEIYNIGFFQLSTAIKYYPHFYQVKLQISVDVPDYNIINIEGKYRLYGNKSPVIPMSGIMLWLANLLGR